MIPKIPDQKLYASSGSKPFNKLVAYIEKDKIQEQQPLSSEFDNILNYATAPLDKTTKGEKCIAVRTHLISDIKNAAIEMNAVADKNNRSKTDPAFHFILSWPEHEHPHSDAIFHAAEHAIKSLGLAEHQYVLAVHVDTDNIHCHIAVNRIHPVSYHSHHIEWAKKTLHLAARQSEIMHGWTHDNGIYIVEVDDKNNKSIVLNPDHDHTLPHAHRDLQDEILPSWHDPDGLDSWLKSKVARALKRDLPKLASWNALHAWLNRYDITLTDTGGGGMRLHAASPESGEILDMPTSKGLRILKRNELEKRWGAFVISAPVPCIVPDLSHLTHKQLIKGVEHVLRTSLDHGIPPDHIIHPNANRRRQATNRSSGLHDLSFGGLDGGRPNGEMLLPDALHDYLGDEQTGQDQDMRRPRASEKSSRRSLTRDNSKREDRKAQRTEARADLRRRFSQYQRFVRDGDVEYRERVKEIQSERSQALKTIREETKAAKLAVGQNRAVTTRDRTIERVAIDAESLRRKLQVEAVSQEKSQSLRVTHLPALGWRVWLHEQSNLGDQAALSALRGIVYQAQRDAKRDGIKEAEEQNKEANTDEYRKQQYRKVMARLLEEEKNEVAIRSARINTMRPYEADALLARYIGIQWRVTGNGNIEFSDRDGDHLFTDRGNRVTFDRARVSDEDICLALVHAQQKFGKQLTLTGDDSVFTERMARLADDMGMAILNPELQSVIANHRNARTLPIPEAITITPTFKDATLINKPEEQELLHQDPDTLNKQVIQLEEVVIKTPLERLRAKVFSIDPRAEFVAPNISDSHNRYIGPVAAILEEPEGAVFGFAQHIGRGVYVLHFTSEPVYDNDASVEVQYNNGQPVITTRAGPGQQKGKEHDD